MSLARPGINTLLVLWLIAGVATAATHDYFDHVDNGRRIASAILAVVLWPLLFLDINLHVDP
jgi:hypothetical protein